MFAALLFFAAIQRRLIACFMGGAAAFLVVLPTAVAAGGGRLVFVTLHAGLCFFGTAASRGFFSRTTGHGLVVFPVHLVAATGLPVLRAGSLVAEQAVCLCLGRGILLWRWWRRVLSCGLSPRRYRQGQDQCSQFQFHGLDLLNEYT